MKLNEAQARTRLLKSIVEYGGVCRWAEAHGVTRQHLHHGLTSGKPLPPALLAAVGLKRVTHTTIEVA